MCVCMHVYIYYCMCVASSIVDTEFDHCCGQVGEERDRRKGDPEAEFKLVLALNKVEWSVFLLECTYSLALWFFLQ